jgi:hypothetical protein
VDRDRGSPEEDGRGVCLKHSDEPFAGAFIPKERGHSLSEAAPPKSADDKELVYVMGADVA